MDKKMDKEVAETIFGRLHESSIKANLEKNEFTFKVDRKFGRFMGTVVKLEDGVMYESHACGDGMIQLMRTSAERQGFRFVSSADAGLFKK